MSLVTLRPPTLERFVNSGWGAPRAHRDGTHAGLDFPSKVGRPVLAAADGLVVRVKNIDNSLAGKFVAIRHDGGVVTRYLHNLQNDVEVGERVAAGQRIASVGQTGTTGTGTPHVHFDVLLEPAAFAEYRQRFGDPVPGYGASTGLGIGVPAEALMSGAIYARHVLESGRARGVTFRKSSGLLGILVAGAGVGLLIRYLR